MATNNIPIPSAAYNCASKFVDNSVYGRLRFDQTPTQDLKLILGEHSNLSQSASLISPIDAFDANYYSLFPQQSHSNELALRVPDLPAISQRTREIIKPGEYKWKGQGWRVYDDQIVQSFHKIQEEMRQVIKRE
jgi:hypothetical protein